MGGCYTTYMTALSANGAVAVGTGSMGSGTQPLRWPTTSSAPVNLIPPGAGTSGAAEGVSADCATVVGFVRVAPTGPHPAAIWSVDQGQQSLASPTGFTISLLAISDDGRTAVSALGGAGPTVVYRRELGVVPFYPYMWRLGVDPCSVEVLRGVSADGRVMLGVFNGGSCLIDLGRCGSADFNHDGDAGTDQDIEAFFRCLSGDCCPWCDTADFNGDGEAQADQDIEAFFRVLGGGSC